MRILFAGTPDFAVPALEALADRFPVAGVLTQPDASQGRGRRVAASPVKEAALKRGLPVLEPEALDADFIERVKALRSDLLVCAAIGIIFRRPFLDVFPRGGINMHPSLLPRFRGPSPIPAAILAGDSETGVTIQRLALKMDTGDILAQTRLPIGPSDTTASLTETLAWSGAALCAEVVSRIGDGTIQGAPQDESAATYCRLLAKNDGRLDFKKSAAELERMIRAYTPWPLAFAFYRGKRIFLLRGGVYSRAVSPAPAAPTAPGAVLGMDKDCGILIHTGNGILCVSTLQLEFKKALAAGDFLNGHRDFIGGVLSDGGGT